MKYMVTNRFKFQKHTLLSQIWFLQDTFYVWLLILIGLNILLFMSFVFFQAILSAIVNESLPLLSDLVDKESYTFSNKTQNVSEDLVKGAPMTGINQSEVGVVPDYTKTDSNSVSEGQQGDTIVSDSSWNRFWLMLLLGASLIGVLFYFRDYLLPASLSDMFEQLAKLLHKGEETIGAVKDLDQSISESINVLQTASESHLKALSQAASLASDVNESSCRLTNTTNALEDDARRVLENLNRLENKSNLQIQGIQLLYELFTENPDFIHKLKHKRD